MSQSLRNAYSGQLARFMSCALRGKMSPAASFLSCSVFFFVLIVVAAVSATTTVISDTAENEVQDDDIAFNEGDDEDNDEAAFFEDDGFDEDEEGLFSFDDLGDDFGADDGGFGFEDDDDLTTTPKCSELSAFELELGLGAFFFFETSSS